MRVESKRIPKENVSRITPIPNLKIIGDQELFEIIKSTLEYLKDKDGVIQRTLNDYKGDAYTLVLAELKNKKWYYPELSLRKILSLATPLLPSYRFKDYFFPKNAEDEYDTLCQLKANGQDYDRQKFNILKNKVQQ